MWLLLYYIRGVLRWGYSRIIAVRWPIYRRYMYVIGHHARWCQYGVVYVKKGLRCKTISNITITHRQIYTYINTHRQVYTNILHHTTPHNVSKVPYSQKFQKFQKITFEILKRNLAIAKDIRIFTPLCYYWFGEYLPILTL